MKAQGKRSKGMRAMAAAFALAIGLTSFNGLSAWAGKMKKDTVKKEYTTADIDGSLVTTEKKAVRTGDNAFDVTLSVTGQSFDYDKQVQVKNTDFVFVVDTSASMNEDGNWNNLKTVLGDEWTYSDNASLVNNILGKDKSLGNTVTFVGYNGNRLINSSSDYYISDKFNSDNIRNAIEEYSDYNKMSGKIKGNTAGGNIIAGFRGARKVINSMKREGRNQIAVLLTDGNPSIVYRQLSKQYTLYADTTNIPEVDNGWEKCSGQVKCWYYKKSAEKGKYIFSDDEITKSKEGLITGYSHYKYFPKWKKIVSEEKVKFNETDSDYSEKVETIIKEAEWLKKTTSNNRIYTINVTSDKHDLFENAIFADRYYNGTEVQAGNIIYNAISNDINNKVKFTYKPTNIKIYDKLSDFVKLNEKEDLVVNVGTNKVLINPGTEENGIVSYVSTVNNWGLGKIEIKYNKADKSFSWDIEAKDNIPGKFSLTYKIIVDDEKAIIPNEGTDEDYANETGYGLIVTDKNTGNYAERKAYPVGESKVSYGVSEVSEAGKSNMLEGNELEVNFPKAGVRADVVKYDLTVTHIYGDKNKAKTETLVKGSAYSKNTDNEIIEAGWEYSNATVDGEAYNGNLPIEGTLNKNTEIIFYYEKKPVAPKMGKVVVRDIFSVYGKNDTIVERINKELVWNTEETYSALKSEELATKAGENGYPVNAGSYVASNPEVKQIKVDKDETIVEFFYSLKEEKIDVYDHFNGGGGILRQGTDVTVAQGNKIEYVQQLTADEINALGHEGEWKTIEQTDGRYFTVENNNGVRSVHFYYVQKADIMIRAHYTTVLGDKIEEDFGNITDKYIGDIAEYTDNETDSEYILKKIELDGNELDGVGVNKSSRNVKFEVTGNEMTLVYYYEAKPEGRIFQYAKHTYKSYYEDGSDGTFEYEISGKEGEEYTFKKKEILGWKLSEVRASGIRASEDEVKGVFGDDQVIEFIYEKDIVDIVVKNIYQSEDDSIQNEVIVHKTVKAKRGDKVEFEPELDENHENWVSDEGKKIVDTSPDFGTEKVTVFNVSFIFRIKKVDITVKHQFDNDIKSNVSKTAIDTNLEISEQPREGWKLKEVRVENKIEQPVDGKVTVMADKDKEVVFIYEKITTQTPDQDPSIPDPETPSVTPEPDLPPVTPDTPSVTPGTNVPAVVPSTPSTDSTTVDITEDTTPQGEAPATDPQTVDITEDSTPQGKAPVADNDEDSEDSDVVDLDEDEIPQGEAATDDDMDIDEDAIPKGIAPEVTVEEDTTPQGGATLPKTGGTSADIFRLIGLGLISLGLFAKKRK